MGKLTDIRADTALLRPHTDGSGWLEIVGGIAGAVAIGGGLYLVIESATPVRAEGATRSSHIQWEERRLEIELAAEEQDAETAEEQDGPEDAR